MRRTKNSIAALCAAALIASAAVVGLLSASAPARPRPPVVAMAAKTSVSVTYPAPAPAYVGGGGGAPVHWSGPTRASVDCPEMNNPGGRNVVIEPPGPDRTDGDVSLPSLGVDAPLVRVGFDGTGNMVLPHNARDVAWLDQGAFPGAQNNIVLAGHINWGGVPGSFGQIDRLRPGEVVTIVLHGKTWKYAVRWSCLLPYNSSRGNQVIGYTTVPSLTMVSCAGTWNAYAGTHSQRIIVRAEQIYPVPPAPKQSAGSSSGHGGSSSGGNTQPSPTPTPSSGGSVGGLVPLHN